MPTHLWFSSRRRDEKSDAGAVRQPAYFLVSEKSAHLHYQFSVQTVALTKLPVRRPPRMREWSQGELVRQSRKRVEVGAPEARCVFANQRFLIPPAPK